MTNIERAIEKLGEVTKIRCGSEFSQHHTVNLNDCRAEIVALMRAANKAPRQAATFLTVSALAAKILGEQG